MWVITTMETFQGDLDNNYRCAHYGHTPDPTVTGTWGIRLTSNPAANPYYLGWGFEWRLCGFVRDKC